MKCKAVVSSFLSFRLIISIDIISSNFSVIFNLTTLVILVTDVSDTISVILSFLRLSILLNGTFTPLTKIIVLFKL